MNTDKFIARAKDRFGDRFDYSPTIYVNARAPIQFICPIHGLQEQNPMQHLRGTGCPKCDDDKQRHNTDDFIRMAREIHGDRYDYTPTEYTTRDKEVKIICKTHGEFKIIAANHLAGGNCPDCAKLEAAEKNTLNQDEFIARAKAIHRDRFDFSQTHYIKMDVPVIVICPKHGPFSISPNNLLSGSGCPDCATSKGEIKVKYWLEDHDIQFKWHYTLRRRNVKKNISGIISDFYVKDANAIIEYNGRQHYEPFERFGGEEKFKIQQKRDSDEVEICKERGLNLIVIPYTEFNRIGDFLEEKLTPLIRRE